MTPNQAKIVLTNPCSENWNSMQVDPVGRFCQSCQKSVIDFSLKTDDEIKAFLQDKKGEKLCGRFYVHQVERIRIEIDQNVLFSDIPFWQKFLVVVLVCFGQDFLGTDFVFAQTDSVPVQTEQIDSLAPVTLSEADTTLEVIVDSVQKPIQHKKNKTEFILYYPMPMISGSIMLAGDHYPLFDGIPAPPLEIPFDKEQAKKDTLDSKTGIAAASKDNPILPKRRRRKPTPPENAVIADSDDRRKIRRA